MTPKPLLLKNIRQIVQIVDDDSCSLLGPKMRNIKVGMMKIYKPILFSQILEDNNAQLEILCADGKIQALGTREQVRKKSLSKCKDVVSFHAKLGPLDWTMQSVWIAMEAALFPGLLMATRIQSVWIRR